MRTLVIFVGILLVTSILQGQANFPSQQPSSQQVDDLFVILKDGLNGYMDNSGKIVIQPHFESWERNFAEKRAVYGVSPKPFDVDHTKFGYIDEMGQVVVQPKFDAAQDFSDGLAAVAFNAGKKSKHEFERPRRWGFIDKDGKIVVTPQFRRVRPFSGGLAAVQNLQNKWGYIDPSGKIIVPLQFEYAASFSEGKAAVQTGEQFGFIDRTGTLIIPAQFLEAGNFSEGLARVGITGRFPNAFFAPHQFDVGAEKFGYIDESGHIMFEIDAVNVEDFSEGLAAFQVENQNANPYAPRPSVVTGRTGFIWCGYVNKVGNVAILPQYQSCGPFAEGLANVFLDGSWQYVDSTGKTVLSAPYYWVGPFRHGLAPVRDGNYHRGYIDKSGKLVFLTPTATR
jgi:WG containing repeat